MSYLTKLKTIRTDAALTGSYVYTNGYSTSGSDQLTLLNKWTDGDCTTIEICVQFSDTPEFTDAYSEVIFNSAGDGTETMRTRVYVLDATSPANSKINIASEGLYFRVGAKATGGTPTDKLQIKARVSNVEKGV